jgi:hypothetical protein
MESKTLSCYLSVTRKVHPSYRQGFPRFSKKKPTGKGFPADLTKRLISISKKGNPSEIECI